MQYWLEKRRWMIHRKQNYQTYFYTTSHIYLLFYMLVFTNCQKKIRIQSSRRKFWLGKTAFYLLNFDLVQISCLLDHSWMQSGKLKLFRYFTKHFMLEFKERREKVWIKWYLTTVLLDRALYLDYWMLPLPLLPMQKCNL